MNTQLILDGQEKIKNIALIKRDIEFDEEILQLNKIITFIWPRRAGKTYFMFQCIKDLIEKWNIKLEQVVFIDFAEILEKEIDFNQILKSFYSLHPHNEPFFVFDEIQEVSNFKEWVTGLFNKWFKIFLSWSNAKLLSEEIATEFRWRNYEIFILPLNFKEFLKFQWFEIKTHYSSKEEWELDHLFNLYLQYWWYPEISLIKNNTIKENILKNYLDILIYKDVKERYWVDNDYLLKVLIKKILLWFTKIFSVNKIFNDLKSQNIQLSKNTLYNYIEYLENVFFIKRINNLFSPKWFFKLYFFDIWYTNNLKIGNNITMKFENIIFIELLRKYKNVSYKQWTTWEIDFYIDNIDTDIQVCYDLHDKNSEREIKLLEKSKAKNKLVVVHKIGKKTKLHWINIIDYKKFFLS